jgi:hypothetical protein
MVVGSKNSTIEVVQRKRKGLILNMTQQLILRQSQVLFPAGFSPKQIARPYRNPKNRCVAEGYESAAIGLTL